MNTLNDPHVREAFAQLSSTFHRMDTKLTAARSALETKRRLSCNAITPADLSTRVTPLRTVSPVLTAVDRKMIASLDALKPVACVPGFQDVDADAPNYFKALSGRMA